MSHYVEDEAEKPAYLDRAEKRWLRVSVVVLGLFLAAVAVVTAAGFQHLPAATGGQSDCPGTGCRTPAGLLQSAPFSDPRVVTRDDGSVDVYLVGRMWEWSPRDIQLPVGRPVRFIATSADVIHGFRVLDTPINLMVFPGAVASEQFTFTRPGTYRVACTEYCGVNHQNMVSHITVGTAP